MNKPTHALIDGDILRYQLGAVLSKGDVISFGGAKIDVPQSLSAVEQLVNETVQGILDSTGTKSCTVYLSEKRNFRHERATILQYKGNRTGFCKPYHWGSVEATLRKNQEVYDCIGFEADDYLAAHQKEDGSTVICSRDKDLRGVFGWHYSWGVGKQVEKPLRWVDHIDGARWFYNQCLTGDSTDNILGCAKRVPDKNGRPRRKGIGKGKAETLLQHATTEQELFNIVARQYIAIIGDDWKEQFKENATLLYMSKELTPWEDLETTNEMFRKFENED